MKKIQEDKLLKALHGGARGSGKFILLQSLVEKLAKGEISLEEFNQMIMKRRKHNEEDQNQRTD